jgi:hypothetical protein
MTPEEKLAVCEEELRRKDEMIQQLREENEVLLRAALKRAEQQLELKERLEELGKRKDNKGRAARGRQ